MSAPQPSLTPLSGSASGETFLAEAGEERTVVRIYSDRGARRGTLAVSTDAAVLRWVRGLLPVPEVLEVRQPEPALDAPAVLVTSLLPGVRGDLLLTGLAPKAQARMGKQVAGVLQRLAGIATARAGTYSGPDLSLVAASPARPDLPAWVESHRRALSGWSRSERSKLMKLATRAQSLLDPTDRTCLIHGDFSLENLLIDPETFAVTGVLDWECARSGRPHADLGSLLRSPHPSGFVGALLEELVALDRALGLPAIEERLVRARAEDLFALVELAARRGEDPRGAASDARLRELASAGHLDGELSP